LQQGWRKTRKQVWSLIKSSFINTLEFEIAEIDKRDEYPETVRFYCNYQTEETPAPVHFALPKSLHSDSVLVITYVLLFSVSIICIGNNLSTIFLSHK
jgi:hypothetical protein